MLKKGNPIVNVNDGKKIKLARIVPMHSDEMEEIDEAMQMMLWQCLVLIVVVWIHLVMDR